MPIFNNKIKFFIKNIMKKNIVIIYGSKSTEHDISILTALQTYNAIDKQKYNVDLVYITHNGKWLIGPKLADINFYVRVNEKKCKEVCILPCSNFLYVKKFGGFKMCKKIDCAVLCLHGKNGEDGTIQGLLELSNIPYTSSGVLGSAVGIDKITMKEIFAYNDIPIVEHIVLNKNEFINKKFKTKDITNKIKYPLIIKPNKLGSSIGLSLAKNAQELKSGLDLAFMFDDKVIIEKAVKNLKEVNISVLGDSEYCEISVSEEVQNKGGLLSFEKKYLANNSAKTTAKCTKLHKKSSKIDKNYKNFDNYNLKKKKNEVEFFNNNEKFDNSNCNNSGTKNGMQNLNRIIPANITTEQANEIQSLAKKIFGITNSSGVVRIDFMIDTKTGKVYANEINTIPGSLAFYLWEQSGLPFEKLIDKMIEIAEAENLKKNRLLTTFSSSVLGNNNGAQK
ncbi:MAG TPA: D-alanine--D-alanine ligase [Clostridiales bacterium]|nr:D-alanine--D-alanine ligase [Clostridiales bacterium]